MKFPTNPYNRGEIRSRRVRALSSSIPSVYTRSLEESRGGCDQLESFNRVSRVCLYKHTKVPVRTGKSSPVGEDDGRDEREERERKRESFVSARYRADSDLTSPLPLPRRRKKDRHKLKDRKMGYVIRECLLSQTRIFGFFSNERGNEVVMRRIPSAFPYCPKGEAL